MSVRQSAIASNIANANVPSYKATDTVSFSDTLANAASTLAATDGKHFGAPGSSTQYQAHSTERSVSLETELVKSGEVRSAMQLNTGIVTSFHRMLLMTVKA
ncbi:MAG: flagellar basal body protein [Pseudomonadota bacterium]